MNNYAIEINWEGPLAVYDVIKARNDSGKKDNGWAGCDYGVYQICGPHILSGNNALLYVGKAADQTFSQRFRQHKKDLLLDEDYSKIKIYLGKLKDRPQYTKENNWGIWYRDVDIVEATLIYKYSPHYNSARLNEYPGLYSYKRIDLIHTGSKGRLKREDSAPFDFKVKL
jgi:hypothetical protein